MVKIAHIFIITTAVIAPVLAVPFDTEDTYYARDFEELDTREPILRWARKAYRRIAPYVRAAGRLLARDLDEQGLYARDLDDHDLFARELDDLFQALARDFDNEIDAREFDDELDARQQENTYVVSSIYCDRC